MAKLLVIDDDETGARTLARLLETEGHQATCASSAGSALLHMREDDPDLVLLDLSMPKVNGFELLDALAAEPRFAHVRFAVYSGSNDDSARATAMKLGACDFIQKGMDWSETYERIKGCLKVEKSKVPPVGRITIGASSL